MHRLTQKTSTKFRRLNSFENPRVPWLLAGNVPLLIPVLPLSTGFTMRPTPVVTLSKSHSSFSLRVRQMFSCSVPSNR